MIDFIDKTATNSGTPLNRENMMAIQGFIGVKTQILDDGTIIETNSKGQTKTTTFEEDGSIKEVFVADKTITKTTIFRDDGSIDEVIS